MRGFGYAVSRNKPYAGGFITEHYGNPATGLHAIQLEINRALYMDERRYERSSGFFDRLAGELEQCWPTDWPKSRWRNCAPIALRPNSPTGSGSKDRRTKKKGRSPCGSGPSLGRKRPRRATVTRESLSLPHCNNIHRVAQNASVIDLFSRCFSLQTVHGLPFPASSPSQRAKNSLFFKCLDRSAVLLKKRPAIVRKIDDRNAVPPCMVSYGSPINSADCRLRRLSGSRNAGIS